MSNEDRNNVNPVTHEDLSVDRGAIFIFSDQETELSSRLPTKTTLSSLNTFVAVWKKQRRGGLTARK